MSARIAARVQACLRGFWIRQTARAKQRRDRLYRSLSTDLPVYYNKLFRNSKPAPTFETPRTHHTHTEMRQARHAPQKAQQQGHRKTLPRVRVR